MPDVQGVHQSFFKKVVSFEAIIHEFFNRIAFFYPLSFSFHHSLLYISHDETIPTSEYDFSIICHKSEYFLNGFINGILIKDHITIS